MIRLTSLARLQYRHFSYGSKFSLWGALLLLLYFWGVEFVFFITLRDEIATIPQHYFALAFLLSAIPEFFLTLFLVPDSSVMDAFLRTRPIPKAQWKRFLALSQFWNVVNLFFPLASAPLLFLFLPFVSALLLLLVLYLLCVFNGYLVMLIKRRSPYESEKMVSKASHGTYQLSARHARLNLQFKSLIRSKRLRMNFLISFFFFLSQYMTRMMDDRPHKISSVMLFFAIFLPVCQIHERGLGVEAYSFNAYWTRPGRISDILTDKYWLGILLGLIISVITGICNYFLDAPCLQCVCYATYSAGFGGLLYLFLAYLCAPFDLFGKTFFNIQGTGTNLLSLLMLLVIMGLYLLVEVSLPAPDSLEVLAGIGLLGFAFHRPVFRLAEKQFLKNRYKYMDNYSKK